MLFERFSSTVIALCLATIIAACSRFVVSLRRKLTLVNEKLPEVNIALAEVQETFEFDRSSLTDSCKIRGLFNWAKAFSFAMLMASIMLNMYSTYHW